MARPYRRVASDKLQNALLAASLTAALISLSACASEAARHPEAVYARIDLEKHAGDLPRAGEEAARAFAAWKRQPDSYWNWMFRLQLAETLLARGEAGTAAPLLEPDPPPGLPARMALTARELMDRGYGQYIRSNFPQSLALLDRALELAASSGSADLASRVRIYRSFALTRLNRFEDAESELRAAFADAGRTGNPYLAASASGSMAFLLINEYRYDEARQWTEDSLALSTKDGFDAITAANLLNLGHSNFRLGDLDHALKNFTDSEQLMAAKGKKIERQLSLANLADVQYARGDKQAALATYRRALSISEELGDDFWIAKWLVNMAGIYTEAGDIASALPLNRRAAEIQSRRKDALAALYPALNAADIAAAQRDFDSARRGYREVLSRAPAGSDLAWETRADLAELCFAQGDEACAREEVARTLQVIDADWSRLNDRSKMTFPIRTERFYDEYLAFLSDRNRGEEALAFAESRRAQLLAEKLGTRSAAPAAGGLPALARANRAALLSYWLGPKRSFGWVVTESGVREFPLPGEGVIAGLVRDFHSAIIAGRDPDLSSHPAARRLYDILVRPAGSIASGGSRVILAPDGILHGLNFDTLAGPDGRYWIEQASIEVVPSLALLGRGTPSPARGASLLLIGDPAESDPPLNNAGREIDALTALYRNAVVRRGADATPEAYLESDPGRFSTIHFTAHATANPEDPLDSAVLLSPGRAPGKLYARQVLSRPLRAGLVTVSACETAAARTYSGEGPVGFAWAFLSAGAQNVVASLWRVDDRTTSDLMAAMYRHIRNGARPAEALRAAKLAFVHAPDYRAKPYYWAPFQVYIR